MIQPVKKLHICSLTVQGFKGFAESHTFTFSDMNTITGHNGQGKTSIADAIAFAIVGVPFFGGARLDHLYHQETRDISVELDGQIRAAAQSLEQVRARVYQSKFAQALSDAQARIDALGKEVSRQKHIVAGLKPGVQCPMCRQTVTEATLPRVRDEFKASVNSLCRQGREQTGQLAELKELDAKALAKFEEFKQADTEKAEAALTELTSRRANLVENAQRDNAQRRQEIDRLHAEIQNIELDLEYGRLVQDEYERLCAIKGQLVTLETEIGILNEQASSPSLTTLDNWGAIPALLKVPSPHLQRYRPGIS